MLLLEQYSFLPRLEAAMQRGLTSSSPHPSLGQPRPRREAEVVAEGQVCRLRQVSSRAAAVAGGYPPLNHMSRPCCPGPCAGPARSPRHLISTRVVLPQIGPQIGVHSGVAGLGTAPFISTSWCVLLRTSPPRSHPADGTARGMTSRHFSCLHARAHSSLTRHSICMPAPPPLAGRPRRPLGGFGPSRRLRISMF